MKKTPLDISRVSRETPWIPGMSDSHFHSQALADQGLDPRKLLRELRNLGMGPLMDVAITPEDTDKTGDLPRIYPALYRSCGLHPVASCREDWREALALIDHKLSQEPFSALGETGLDWYRTYAPRERQQEIFDAQLALASSHGLPVIVHNREADQDCLEALKKAALSRGGIMHCFSSSPTWVKSFVDAGMYISFAGNITFPSARELREALVCVPKERLLLETDAPFLAPHPHRGKLNHPAMVAFTYATAAELRGENLEDLVHQVSENLETLLGDLPQ
ncbi:TatD DNase family protein [Alkalispirochaeta americana]|uniref:TatD DNase family protein n=1 Tax=Alkalispirochaeta americana TaxID=159291 RepID=A0A1N6WEL0_9SPIO|nr:TatD family hydrolase [Alkalispirochaeta americana]SIQ88410.1 TatD DNase family protein [Alkalispirochaeta americana]